MEYLKGGNFGDKDESICIITVPNKFSIFLKIKISGFYDPGYGNMDSSP
jgi:hypothetical protein